MAGIQEADIPNCPVLGCKKKGFMFVGTKLLCGEHVMRWQAWKKEREAEMVEDFAKSEGVKE